MKNIIFLTDFSEHADNALDYLAAFVKNQPDCNVYLIHTYILATKTGMFLSVKERIREDARALLINRKRRFEESTNYKHFVFFKAIEGGLSNVTEKLERQLEAELIVTAMRGEGTDKSNLIGPNAGKLIVNTKVPLLLIPPRHAYNKPNKVTFALKYPAIKSADTVSLLNDLMLTPDAKLKVLLTKGDKQNIQLHLDDQNYTVKESSQESIYDAIMEEQASDPADLITVIRRDRGFFERFLKSGSFKRELLDINVPILILRGAQ